MALGRREAHPFLSRSPTDACWQSHAPPRANVWSWRHPMGLASRAAAVFFCAILVAACAASLHVASAGERYGCARGDRGARSCSASSRHSTARRARPRLYQGDEGAMRQLSPQLRPRRVSRLRFNGEPQNRCDAVAMHSWASRRACVAERNLAEALVQPPSAATEKILRENGIPAIRDVPPIVILRSTREGWDWSPFPFSSSH